MESPSYLSPNPTSGTVSSSDYSSDHLANMNEMTSQLNDPTKSTSTERKSTKRSVSSFIQKLYSMLEDSTHSNLISWNPSGTSFCVCNAKVFAAQVLPAHFKHSNFSSFVRLLNMYGFHKVSKSSRGQRSSDKEVWEFSHPKLVRGRPDLLKHIKRKAMDSETMRREAGDIQASFATLRTSQNELLQQFYALQENFTHLLHALDEFKKTQHYQGMQIDRLLEQRGLSKDNIRQPSPPMTTYNQVASAHDRPYQQQQQQQQYQQSTYNEPPFQMMVTTPSTTASNDNAAVSSPAHGYASQGGAHNNSPSSHWLNNSNNNNNNDMTNLSISQSPSSLSSSGTFYCNNNDNDKGMQQQQQLLQSDMLYSPMTLQLAANTPLPPSPNMLASPELAVSPVSSEDSHGPFAFNFGQSIPLVPH